MGGIVVVVVVVVLVLAAVVAGAVRVGEDGGGDCGSGGREKKNERGLRRSVERKGGLRTFRYILNDLKALFACGTYLISIKSE